MTSSKMNTHKNPLRHAELPDMCAEGCFDSVLQVALFVSLTAEEFERTPKVHWTGLSQQDCRAPWPMPTCAVAACNAAVIAGNYVRLESFLPLKRKGTLAELSSRSEALNAQLAITNYNRP